MIIKYIKLVGKKEFAITTLELEHETFIVYVALFSFIPLNTNIYLSCKLQIAGLIAKKVLIKIFAKYIEFANMFFLDLASKLLK